MKESVLWPILQQAREYATSNIGGGTNFDVDKFHNKFAELIVRECARVIDRGDGAMSSMAETSWCNICRDDILKHFGVE